MDYVSSLDFSLFTRPAGNKYQSFGDSMLRLKTEVRSVFSPSFAFGSFTGTVCLTLWSIVLLWGDR